MWHYSSPRKEWEMVSHTSSYANVHAQQMIFTSHRVVQVAHLGPGLSKETKPLSHLFVLLSLASFQRRIGTHMLIQEFLENI